MAKVEADFHDELTRALKDGFTADEVEKAKKTWLDERFHPTRRRRLHRRPAQQPGAFWPDPVMGRQTRGRRRRDHSPAGERRVQTPRRSGHHLHRQRRRLQEVGHVSVAHFVEALFPETGSTSRGLAQLLNLLLHLAAEFEGMIDFVKWLGGSARTDHYDRAVSQHPAECRLADFDTLHLVE